MTRITAITGTTIADSRGEPTLEVHVTTEKGSGVFAVPSGASVGSAEAVELRDEGGGVAGACAHIAEVIAPALIGMDVEGQLAIDDALLALDGTPNKSRLGGNSLIGVSIAVARAAAAGSGQELFHYLRSLSTIAPSRDVPFLYSNYINGGKHADSPVAIQEHMLVPQVDSVNESIAMLEAISRELIREISLAYGVTVSESLGDEGGFVLPEIDPLKPFELLTRAIQSAGHEGRVMIAIDAAASSFYEGSMYRMSDIRRSSDQLIELYRTIASTVPLLSIEDPFEEHAISDAARLQSLLPGVRIVGDDTTVTSAARIHELAEAKAIRAVIIKPNQIGTLSETLDAMQAAREHNIDCIVSHRSGETMDTFVADLAYAFGAFGLKAGALRKPERRVKYERLAAIAH